MKNSFVRGIKEKIKNKRILITGGTGSFGNSVVAYLLNLKPKEIIIFSRDEKKQFDMRNYYDSNILKFIIGDTRDYNSVERVMHNVHFVFHAAALKQVPTCEFFPMEAVSTNIIGGNNVMRAAVQHKVGNVVILSTDKAVYPINAMGMTKALSEKIMVSTARELEGSRVRTVFCAVRYGNVLYSRGSVVPYFVDLIKQKKRLTITNPEMTRFLLPLRYSVELVMHAIVHGKSGHIYVKKAPAATIEVTAKAVAKLFSYAEGVDTIGTRAGEKIHETLLSREEYARVIDEGEFFAIPPETKTLAYERFFSKGRKKNIEKDGYTSENTRRLTLKETVDLLLTLPEIQTELRASGTDKKVHNEFGIYSKI